MNHEAITPAFLHPNGPDEVRHRGTAARCERSPTRSMKEMNVQGVSVIEVAKTAGKWSYKQDLDLQPPHHDVDADGALRARRPRRR